MPSNANNAVLISADGADGKPGTQAWDDTNLYRAGGLRPTRGRDGRDATSPKDGAPGGRLDLAIGFDPIRRGFIQMTCECEGDMAGLHWEVDAAEGEFLLSSRGGNGGTGGVGENGQAGAHGQNGRLGDKRGDGTDGSPGGDGGNGGRGTNGGNGGSGGIIHVRVHEADLDTLVAVRWDVQGGDGGLRGAHGFAGRHGNGGKGGVGYSWTESIPYADTCFNPRNGRYETRTSYRKVNGYTRDGRNGKAGCPGKVPAHRLVRGQDGSSGRSQITVVHADGSTTMYPSRYLLAATEFQFGDESGDGTYKAGSHVIVRDVVVENFGGCPSPGTGSLHILIKSTDWLEPVMEPLVMPGGIPPGQSVQVPGVLKALIKTDTPSRELKTLLNTPDAVSLRAFSPRLRRDVSEFARNRYRLES
ncbi:hypothetical protein V8F06_014712 [Rhypophila decipiens]